MKKKHRVLRTVGRYCLLLIGSILAAVGLEIFLIPNKIIDGGIVGISIISSFLTPIPLGAFIWILNLPFLFWGYKQIGKTFVFSSLFSITSLSIWVSILHPVSVLTKDILLASVFGGIVLGMGVGIIIRHGGSLDGTEITALIINKRTSFSVGEIIMFFNVFILSSAGLVFGWDRAMYSLIAYFIAYKVIDIVVEGLEKVKAVIIISDKGEEISQVVTARLGRGVTLLDGRGGYTNVQKTILYSVITRLEIAKLKSIVYEIDENAFVTINDVSDVMGGKYQKRAIH